MSLTFDDARSSQIDTGLAVLDRLGAKATFYVVPARVAEDLAGWKRLVASGYEIGNHSLRHPCTGNFAWSREAALEDYTLDRMRTELIDGNRQLKEMLGVDPVTFAYPCGQTFVGRGRSTRSYVPVVAELFLAGRGWLDETPNDPTFFDAAQVSGMSMDGMDFSEVKALVESATDAGYWLVLAGHEIGHAGRQTTRIRMLEQLVPTCGTRRTRSGSRRSEPWRATRASFGKRWGAVRRPGLASVRHSWPNLTRLRRVPSRRGLAHECVPHGSG